ncbi:P-loop containing nucleoside triphosphate hydrolase protein [Hymenopellis radicata]|nr:P-loop containing nucleoside triphosphate hydrolase protein [Hymenopellis radicata]
MNEQIVLILVGLVGSGKSTFAQALQEHVPKFRRCNQDDLGNRRKVEQLARDSLRQGYSVCIDRTNFNEAQRSYWIDIAHEFPGTLIFVIVFDTPYEICALRLKERSSHPTIKSPEQGLEVLARFSSDYVPPMNHEGFDRCLHLTPDQTPLTYSQEDVSAILQRVRDSVPVQPPEFATVHSRRGPRGSRPYPYSANRGVRGGGYRRGIRGGSIRNREPGEAFARRRETSSHTASGSTAVLQSHVAEPAGQDAEAILDVSEDRRE